MTPARSSPKFESEGIDHLHVSRAVRQRDVVRSTLLGGLLVIFALAPAVGKILPVENEQLYIWSAASATVLAAVGLLTGSRIRFPFRWGIAALFAFLFLMLLRMPSFDDFAWVAFSSVALSLYMFLLAQTGKEEVSIRGVLLALMIVGAATAYYTVFDPDYAFARTFGYNRTAEAYLISGSTVAATIGPTILAARYANRRLLKILLFGLAAFLSYALLNSLARGALLSGLAALFMGLTYATSSSVRGKATAIMRGFLLFLPVIPVALTFLAGNQYLWWRLQRMMDLEGELTVGGRGSLWGATAQYIEEHVIWGGGVTEVQKYLAGDYPHNALLEAWADLGLFGFLALLAFFVSFAVSMWRAMVRGRSALSFALHLAAFVFVVESLKSGSVYVSRPMMILSLLALASGRLPSTLHVVSSRNQRPAQNNRL